jgi:GTPase SAR1 family protein
MESVNIAVIGALGVGKTSFIQRAFRLPRPPAAASSTVGTDIDGIPYPVTLLEFDLEYFDMDEVSIPGQPLQWPKQINGHVIPRIDGALILYDVTNKDSIKDLSPTLSKLSHTPESRSDGQHSNNAAALTMSGTPVFLVATKCDTPENLRQLSTSNMAAMASSYSSYVGDFQTSSNVPGSQRDCLQSVLKYIVASRRGMSSAAPRQSPHGKRLRLTKHP